MARRKSTPPRQLTHHWFLREWAAQAVPAKTQADAVRDLGWAKATASALFNGDQRYTQDYVDEVSAWLNIRPYELLMSPDLAMAIRAIRSEGLKLVQQVETADTQFPKTGTNG